MKNINFLLIAFLVAATTVSKAQSFTVNNESSSLSVLGSSSLHDWKLKAETVEGKAEFKMSGKELKEIKSLNISVPIASLHSGLGPLDAHMRTAMTANDASTVDFTLIKVTSLTPNTIGGYTVQAEGEISIIKNVQLGRLQATIELRENGDIRFFGEVMIDMTVYSVEPPQAEMGSITTEKDVKVVYDVVLNKTK